MTRKPILNYITKKTKVSRTQIAWVSEGDISPTAWKR